MRLRWLKGAQALRAVFVRPRVMITLIGVPCPARDALVTRLARRLGWLFKPVFVTDDPDFTLFFRRKLAFEYVLTDLSAVDPAKRYDLYLQDRRQLLVAKWRPVGVMVYGRSFEATIKDVRARLEDWRAAERTRAS